jgi:5-methylcytosine-specific restriction endonuclease McrA
MDFDSEKLDVNIDTVNIDTVNIDTVKKIIIVEQETNKKINCKKEKKKRVETNTWGLNEIDLCHKTQLEFINDSNVLKNPFKNKYISKLTSHIKSKLLSYKQQDILKKKYDESKFVSLKDTIMLLQDSKLCCCYCSEQVYILYERVRENQQWSLDRIDNNIGHNIGNLVIACLECNLKRRRTNKDAFMFTKNMVIMKV